MTSKSLPRVFALAPQGIEGVGIAAAACRANALGIIDFNFGAVRDLDKAFVQLRKLTSLPFGIRVAGARHPGSNRRPPRDPVRRRSFASPSGRPPGTSFPGLPRSSASQAGSRSPTSQLAPRPGMRSLPALTRSILPATKRAAGAAQESSFVLLQGVLAESELAGLGARRRSARTLPPAASPPAQPALCWMAPCF